METSEKAASGQPFLAMANPMRAFQVEIGLLPAKADYRTRP
jgi:hypothetical protein